VTGHHLEWLAIMPPEQRVGDHHLRLALEYVIRTLKRCNRNTFMTNVCHYSHGLRACGILIH